MSYSKPLPPFTFDLLCYLNRDKLERFLIVCRPLKNFIERYFHAKSYRVFEHLFIRGGSYALCQNDVQWHPNRDDYSVKQFLAGQRCSVDKSIHEEIYYSFAEMLLYLCPTLRLKNVIIYIAADFIYNSQHIVEMESISYLWREGFITIWPTKKNNSLLSADDLQPIINSQTILQCRNLDISYANFSFKNYIILYTVKVIEIYYGELEPNYWQQFLEQPGVKPIVVFNGQPSTHFRSQNIAFVIDLLSEAFSSAVFPNAFKIVFAQPSVDEPITEFQKTNKNTGEKLELKKGFPSECLEMYNYNDYFYMLERSSN